MSWERTNKMRCWGNSSQARVRNTGKVGIESCRSDMVLSDGGSNPPPNDIYEFGVKSLAAGNKAFKTASANKIVKVTKKEVKKQQMKLKISIKTIRDTTAKILILCSLLWFLLIASDTLLCFSGLVITLAVGFALNTDYPWNKEKN
jgi:hypothetical protein